ncbi:aldo/keto reductase [Bordetella avium]|nr:aldo/keto reductase [Bordetella avium]RIQ38287.1 aldo/keto reductase [Bordetella avium]RIQ39298.1 aldo/keto reductase [Bordetella avium]RIQ48329.1 aldo/keto reductase [Bordetella avium]RIQ69837.1 aldo/keto reductase [Bordetella avium]
MTLTSFPTRQLGNTGMALSRVGFGASAIGGADWAFSWGPQDDSVSVRTIRHAVDRGINWIDTAAAYGQGHAEDMIRQALAQMPPSARPYVFTKGGLLEHQGATRCVGQPDSLRRELEGSLKRLGVECIDLYQMHRPATDGTPLEVYWQTLLDFKREGKVRAVGLSNHSLSQLQAAEAMGHVDSVQPPFSAIRRDAGDGILPWCESRQTGVIVYSPMQSGLLSGAFDANQVLPENDWRSRDAAFQAPDLERNLSLADALRPLAERHGTTVGTVAIAWTLAWPGVTGAIVGARSPAQVDDWLGAATLELDDDAMQLIADACARTGAGSGPLLPPESESLPTPTDFLR